MKAINTLLLLIVLAVCSPINTLKAQGTAYGCTSCAAPCGPACGFATNPTVAQVTANCPQYIYSPELSSNQTNTGCYTFVAANTTVNFNVIITSTCGSGNVSAFSWTLRRSTCAALLQSGNLSSLTFTGLTIGLQYTFCYTFTVPDPSGPFICTHSNHYPYFVGAAPLPVELAFFHVENDNNEVNFHWQTSSERENDFFTVERTTDGEHFEAVLTEKGAGNSTETIDYYGIDANPIAGTTYYRLKQTDFNGVVAYSDLQTVSRSEDTDNLFTIVPNPISNDQLTLKFKDASLKNLKCSIYSLSGQKILENDISIASKTWSSPNKFDSGIYLIELIDETGNKFLERFSVN